jgi:hypothetical protein
VRLDPLPLPEMPKIPKHHASLLVPFTAQCHPDSDAFDPVRSTTQWVDDSKLLCRAPPDQTAAAEKLIGASPPYDGAAVCRGCASTEVIRGCDVASTGMCVPCRNCATGELLRGCVPGTPQEGQCEACPTGTFQDTPSSSSSCSPCTSCAGPNAAGVSYSASPCTAHSDTVCLACMPCEGGGVRVGCGGGAGGEGEGACDDWLDPRITILSTASMRVGRQVAASAAANSGVASFYIDGAQNITLGGGFIGSGVKLPGGVTLQLRAGGGGGRRQGGSTLVSVSAVAVPLEMVSSLRLSGGGIGEEGGLLSDVLHVSPATATCSVRATIFKFACLSCT